MKFWLSFVLAAAAALAGELEPLPLPPPEITGGKPLMRVLRDRHSSRDFRAAALPAQVLSNLLWAAFGANRPDGRRTAPSASNRQEIDVYVAASAGLYRFDGKAHRLEAVLGEDVRGATGSQGFVRDAPLNLVYVADYARMQGSDENKLLYAAADTGFIAQNVYLFCASEGLATVVRGSVDRAALAKVLRLRPEQRVVLAQTVGYPK